MEHIHLFEVISQVFAFIGPQNAKGQAQQGPQMHGFPGMLVHIRHVMDLGMAVVAWGDAVIRLGGQNLVGLGLAVGPALLLESRLEIPAAAAAAEVVGPVGGHVNKIFFAHNGPDHIPQVFGHRISKAFSHQLARILNRELDLTVFVPV